jgi:hypothetical protein
MGSFEMWRWRQIEKIRWTDHVRNKKIQKDEEDRNILPTIKRRQVNWTGHT